jgi:hypothetical protein
MSAAPEVLVTLDSGSVDRLGVLADRVAAARHVLVVDHHPTNPRFGTVNLCDDDAAATVVLVAELLDRLGVPLTLELAAPLYTGLVTDTGSFRYRATTPQVHELAARLLATGLRHDLIARSLWDSSSLAYVQLLGRVCARAQVDAAAASGLGMVWTCVDTDDLARAGLAVGDVEGVIDVVRTAREAEVAGRAQAGRRALEGVDPLAGGHRRRRRLRLARRGRPPLRRRPSRARSTRPARWAPARGPGRGPPPAGVTERPPPAPDGLLVVDKPPGWTSHDVVGRTRRLARTKKVGHAGTPGPDGHRRPRAGHRPATRLLGHLSLTDKAYDATIRLGATTVTDGRRGRRRRAARRLRRQRRGARRGRRGADRADRSGALVGVGGEGRRRAQLRPGAQGRGRRPRGPSGRRLALRRAGPPR